MSGDVRAEFEKWAREHWEEVGYGPMPPQRTAEGYAYGPTQLAWLGWQAGRNAGLEAAARCSEKLGDPASAHNFRALKTGGE